MSEERQPVKPEKEEEDEGMEHARNPFTIPETPLPAPFDTPLPAPITSTSPAVLSQTEDDEVRIRTLSFATHLSTTPLPSTAFMSPSGSVHSSMVSTPPIHSPVHPSLPALPLRRENFDRENSNTIRLRADVTLPPFDATRVDKWVEHILLLISETGWSDVDINTLLISKTTGPVLQWVAYQRKQNVGGRELLELMRREFRPVDQQRRLVQEFYQRRQRPAEPVDEFTRAWVGLLHQVAPTKEEEEKIQLYTLALQPGLADDILLSSPKTLDDAIRMARLRESIVLTNAARSASVNNVSFVTPSAESQMAALRFQLEEAHRVNLATRRETVCHACGNRGHMMSECRKTQGGTRPLTQGYSPSSSGDARQHNTRGSDRGTYRGNSYRGNSYRGTRGNSHQQSSAPSAPATQSPSHQGNEPAQLA